MGKNKPPELVIYILPLLLVDEDELKHNLELMNNRPRKCLGYKTPNEVMNEIDSHTSCCT